MDWGGSKSSIDGEGEVRLSMPILMFISQAATHTVETQLRHLTLHHLNFARAAHTVRMI